MKIVEIFDTPEEIFKAYAYDKLCENNIDELTDEEFLALKKIIKSSVEENSIDFKEVGNFIKNLADERNKDNQQEDFEVLEKSAYIRYQSDYQSFIDNWHKEGEFLKSETKHLTKAFEDYRQGKMSPEDFDDYMYYLSKQVEDKLVNFEYANRAYQSFMEELHKESREEDIEELTKAFEDYRQGKLNESEFKAIMDMMEKVKEREVRINMQKELIQASNNSIKTPCALEKLIEEQQNKLDKLIKERQDKLEKIEKLKSKLVSPNDSSAMDELRKEYQESQKQEESKQEMQTQQDDNVRRQK